ncbi:MAG: amidohydrolase family protein, partial [Bacteroidia bacterium]|nr:amidohydrolase family protein [Bacteroidia bacterium]
DEVLTVLRKNQTWQIPTLALISGFVERPFLSEDWQKSIDLLPDSIADNWKKGIKTLSEQEIPENTKKYAEWALSMTKKVHDMDIGIMAGTDCPIFYLTPGRSLHQELAIFSKAGLDPLEVLKTATLRPAQYFGLESELGLIKEGYIADLVLLNKNPLDDIQNTLEIDAVIKSGKYHDRSFLMQQLIGQ